MKVPIRRPKLSIVNTATRPAPKRTAPPSPTAQDMSRVKVTPMWVDINDIVPYVYNARDNSAAVAAVAESIKNFGFLVPVVIDAEGNLAAGHTRIEAAKSLGMSEVLALRAEHLTAEQIDAFRLVDNKVSELATWDADLLGQELSRLTEVGFDFTQYGWSEEEIDCLSSVVSADCLSISSLTPEASQSSEPGMTTRRGPQSTRLVLGGVVIFIPTTSYNDWIDGLQRMVNFDKLELEALIKNRLGILE